MDKIFRLPHLLPDSTIFSNNFFLKSGLNASGKERIPLLNADPVEKTVAICSEPEFV